MVSRAGEHAPGKDIACDGEIIFGSNLKFCSSIFARAMRDTPSETIRGIQQAVDIAGVC